MAYFTSITKAVLMSPMTFGVLASSRATTFNARIISLRFFFSITCGREEMKRYMQFHRQPRRLPVVLSVEEVAKLWISNQK